MFAEADGVIVEVGTDRKWKIAGRPIALAAGDGKLYVATKEGPLWEVDRATGTQRNLGLGDWWGTIALAYGDHALYAVTVAGKLWKHRSAATTRRRSSPWTASRAPSTSQSYARIRGVVGRSQKSTGEQLDLLDASECRDLRLA